MSASSSSWVPHFAWGLTHQNPIQSWFTDLTPRVSPQEKKKIQAFVEDSLESRRPYRDLVDLLLSVRDDKKAGLALASWRVFHKVTGIYVSSVFEQGTSKRLSEAEEVTPRRSSWKKSICAKLCSLLKCREKLWEIATSQCHHHIQRHRWREQFIKLCAHIYLARRNSSNYVFGRNSALQWTKNGTFFRQAFHKTYERWLIQSKLSTELV